MKNYTARIASIATLAFAFLPIAALSTAAHAGNASVPYAAQRIQTADLNLASASGRAMLAERADKAATSFCRDERNLIARAACETGVRAEVTEKATTNVQMASRI